MDINQLTLTLMGMLREAYPINQVPTAFKTAIESLNSRAEALENDIDGFIEMVGKDLE